MSDANSPVTPSQPEKPASQPAPTPSTPQPAKINNGMGCLTIIIAVVVIAWIANWAGCNESADDKISQEAAGPNNAVVQKIKSLNVNSAYAVGSRNGVIDFANAAQKASQMQGDMIENLQSLQNLRNAQFDLIAAKQSANGVNLSVLSEYRHGWNDGWNNHSVQQ